MAEHEKSLDVTTDEHDKHLPNDTVHLPGGYKITLPGGIYTFIFIVLAVLTVFEWAVSQLPAGPFILPILVVASLFKALLVVMFYMHLNSDNILYRFVLGVPVAVAIVCTLFLLAVPPVAY